MALYEVFSQPVRIKYKASACSNASWFYVFTLFTKFVFPFILIYFSQGFWHKVDFYREQPDVSFKHKMLLVLETKTPNELILWSTYENINKAMEKEFLKTLPEIEHREKDYNKDGIKDELEMSIEIPLWKQEILSIKVLLLFDYKLYSYSDFQMECAAYIYHSAPLPGAEFNVVGDLTLFQREPLWHKGNDQRFNTPVIRDSYLEPPTDFENIFSEYVRRNITTAFTNVYPVWKTVRTENESFNINIIVNYPIETILYRVGFWQSFKWALIQYMSVFLIISFAVHVIQQHVFQNHLLSTVVINPVKVKS